MAQKSASYFTLPGHRDPNWSLAKVKFGSVGIDILLISHEWLCRSDFFLLILTPKFFQLIKKDEGISKDEFVEVITYCIDELQMFDPILFKNGFLFSINFLRYFEAAGLFRNRKYKANDILRCANHYRPGVDPLSLEDELEIIASSDNTLPSASDNLPF